MYVHCTRIHVHVCVQLGLMHWSRTHTECCGSNPIHSSSVFTENDDSLNAVLRCKYIQSCVPIQENKFTIQLEAAVCL